MDGTMRGGVITYREQFRLESGEAADKSTAEPLSRTLVSFRRV
jgi:hypothetical protein